MKTFKDLVFKPHAVSNGIIARVQFPNGYGVSVVKTEYSYGGKDGLFELAVLYNDEIHYDNPIAKGDVVGYLRPEDVTDLMSEVQRF